MITLSHIVAAAENGTIGRNNELPWHIPEDMKFFKEKTLGRAIIMGRKTYESLGRPLPDRLNVVVTRQSGFRPEGVTVLPTVDKAIEFCKKRTDVVGEEIFIIGGGEIFAQTMDKVDLIYLTKIHREIPGDVSYPELDLEAFEEIERRDREEPIPFSFLTYRRRPRP